MDGTKPETTGILMAALEGELGLKLEPQKAPVEVMVVGPIEKPSRNQDRCPDSTSASAENARISADR